ncbi:hypothetical protein GGR54DRAFT_645500 [Hypoxylon sp. NC1633]|nr:hypothetical protein GGR54DRAFT_645500 [Hypoxylon sp. NC1633]
MDTRTQDEATPVAYTSIETFVRILRTKSRIDQFRNALDAFQKAEGIDGSEIIRVSVSRMDRSRTERLMQRAGYGAAIDAKYARYYDEGGVDLEAEDLNWRVNDAFWQLAYALPSRSRRADILDAVSFDDGSDGNPLEAMIWADLANPSTAIEQTKARYYH